MSASRRATSCTALLRAVAQCVLEILSITSMDVYGLSYQTLRFVGAQYLAGRRSCDYSIQSRLLQSKPYDGGGLGAATARRWADAFALCRPQHDWLRFVQLKTVLRCMWP